MKKILIGLAIGATVAGIGLVVKHYRNNEEVEVEEMENEEVEEMENEEVVEEMAIDVEVIDVEDIEIVGEELENDKIKLLDKIKGFVKASKKLVIKIGGNICKTLIKINKKLYKDMYADNPYTYDYGFMGYIKFRLFNMSRYVKLGILALNRIALIVIANICKKLN